MYTVNMIKYVQFSFYWHSNALMGRIDLATSTLWIPGILFFLFEGGGGVELHQFQDISLFKKPILTKLDVFSKHVWFYS